jgi:hypothetical protein
MSKKLDNTIIHKKNNFKQKPEKTYDVVDNKSINELHLSFINEFVNNYDSYANIDNEITKLTKECENINGVNYEQIKQKNMLKSKILELKLKKNMCENNELFYYYKINKILSCHFNNLIDTSSNKDLTCTLSKHKKRNTTGHTINNICPQILNKNNKQELLNKYLFTLNLNKHNINYDISNKLCHICNKDKITLISEGISVCMNCGASDYVLVESDIPNHKDIINDKPKYPYRKINHLTEKLNQSQSKETINIPEHIIKLIEDEIKKSKLSVKKPIINNILHKFKLVSYYEHVPYIYSLISKEKATIFTRELDEQIKQMFRQTQEPFKKYKPPKRSSFLNYNYTVHKLLEILGKHEEKKLFPLLKSNVKLKTLDSIWKNICKDLNWKFIPSYR